MVLVVGQRVDVVVVDGLDAVGAKVEVAGVGQVELVDEGEIRVVIWRCRGAEMGKIVQSSAKQAVTLGMMSTKACSQPEETPCRLLPKHTISLPLRHLTYF